MWGGIGAVDKNADVVFGKVFGLAFLASGVRGWIRLTDLLLFDEPKELTASYNFNIPGSTTPFDTLNGEHWVRLRKLGDLAFLPEAAMQVSAFLFPISIEIGF
jgi:hypothetical protein